VLRKSNIAGQCPIPPKAPVTADGPGRPIHRRHRDTWEARPRTSGPPARPFNGGTGAGGGNPNLKFSSSLQSACPRRPCLGGGGFFLCIEAEPEKPHPCSIHFTSPP